MTAQVRTMSDTLGAGEPTLYDSVWGAGQQLQESGAFERAMLAQDKLYVVLAVVLIVWFGVIFLLLATDRKIRALERVVQERHSSEDNRITVHES